MTVRSTEGACSSGFTSAWTLRLQTKTKKKQPLARKCATADRSCTLEPPDFRPLCMGRIAWGPGGNTTTPGVPRGTMSGAAGLSKVADESKVDAEGLLVPTYACNTPLKVIGVQKETPVCWNRDGTLLCFVLGNKAVCIHRVIEAGPRQGEFKVRPPHVGLVALPRRRASVPGTPPYSLP